MTTTNENAAHAGMTLTNPFIPYPNSISAKARATLSAMAAGKAARSPAPLPPVSDLAAWDAFIEASNTGMLALLSGGRRVPEAKSETIRLGGAVVHVATPASLAPGKAESAYLDIHGGALFYGGGEGCIVMGRQAADRFGVRTYSVDYRVPPRHPYPAALDDCVAAYRALLARHAPSDIVVGGGSAGGNLAAALVLRARDEGLPLPAGAILLTPEVDLTESGDSFAVNAELDVVLSGSLLELNRIYANGAALDHPYLSPLFGDFTKGFPPTLVQAGTRDLFLSNAVRLHRALRRAGVEAELHCFEAMPHGGFFGAPEDRELEDETRRFAERCWTRSV